MAGIYIHVPFCRQACSYCDFYFSISLSKVEDFQQALFAELEQRNNELPDETIKTIYFGGGTPSVLDTSRIKRILSQIYKFYPVSKDAEITLEANPDDLSDDYLKAIQLLGINRLSIGIQSFFDDDLKLMKRRHTGQEAIEVLRRVGKLGFSNFSADLIYAFPGQDVRKLKENLRIMTAEGVPHISIYELTYEPGTPLTYAHTKKRMVSFSDEAIAEQYEIIMDFLETKGYEHYEISNFALPGRYSRHNTSYWKDMNYMGFGPSAHSYNGDTRKWNVSGIQRYIKGIVNNAPAIEFETLDDKEKYNDYILTSLRTHWGVDRRKILRAFKPFIGVHFDKEIEMLLAQNFVSENKGIFTLSRKGKLLADMVCRNLILI